MLQRQHRRRCGTRCGPAGGFAGLLSSRTPLASSHSRRLGSWSFSAPVPLRSMHIYDFSICTSLPLASHPSGLLQALPLSVCPYNASKCIPFPGVEQLGCAWCRASCSRQIGKSANRQIGKSANLELGAKESAREVWRAVWRLLQFQDGPSPQKPSVIMLKVMTCF